MSQVGIEALEQDAPAVVAQVQAGEAVIITDRGRPVAQMILFPASRLAGLIQAGRARPPRRSLTDLASPEPGPELTTVLTVMREADSSGQTSSVRSTGARSSDGS